MIELNVTNYKGPMDLLLSLIEKNKIDIYDIPIKEITESYIQIINTIEISPEEISDFILMASTLIEIKSKMLVPRLNIIEEDPRDDLVGRLLEYKKFKIVSKFLEELKDEARLSFSKVREEFEIETQTLNLDEDVKILSEVFFKLLSSKENKSDDSFFEKKIIKKEEFSVEVYYEIMLDKLIENSVISIKNLVASMTCKQEIITTFLAILELINTKVASIKKVDENDIIIEYR